MIEFDKIIPRKRQRLSSLLGLALDGSRLEGIVLRRTNGSLQPQQTISVTLSLDLLTADPELVGRELRNHLDAAEVRERLCVVGLPSKWALTTHCEIPGLAEADLGSFLQIEGERGFPCDIQTLLVSSSRLRLPSGKQHATLVGVPRNHLTRLEQVLRAARLKPLSFTLPLVALQPPGAESSEGVLALGIGESGVGLQITSGGGIASMRTLEGALELQGSRRILHADLVAREARITLGQLPAELREQVRRIRIFGPRDLGQQLADEMELRLEPLGLKVELANRYAADEFALQLPSDTPVSPALSLAASHLVGRPAPLEFLPPKVKPWQQVAARYSTRKYRLAATVGGSLLLLVAGGLLFQQWQLTSLRAQWTRIAPKVNELEAVQQEIRQFRPWFDDSLRAMTILRQLTTAFPEDGVVTAKTVEIRDAGTVTCIGTTRDNQALLKTTETLRANANVSDLRVVQIRGSKPPLQFTFDFRWNEGGKNEN